VPAHRHPSRTAAFLDARHRPHARVEDRIRCGKDTGRRRFPRRQFGVNTCRRGADPSRPAGADGGAGAALAARAAPPSPVCQVAFHDEIAGIYHEWDAPGRKIADGTAPAANADAYDRAEPSATRAAASDPAPGTIPHPRLDRRPHHRDQQQLLRIARGLDPAGWADQATPSGRSEAADAP